MSFSFAQTVAKRKGAGVSSRSGRLALRGSDPPRALGPSCETLPTRSKRELCGRGCLRLVPLEPRGRVTVACAACGRPLRSVPGASYRDRGEL